MSNNFDKETYKKLLEELQTSIETDPSTKNIWRNWQRGIPLGNVVYRQDQRNNAQAKEFWKTEIQRLNALAREAPTEVANPQVGNFKRGADGFLYRWTDKAMYNARTGQMSGPRWAKAVRKFNYEPNITNAIKRHRRIGYSHQLPEPNPPINNLGYGRRTTQRRNRKSQRKNRKTRRN